MKLRKPIVLRTGVTVPKDTDLQFANGVANFAGNDISLSKLPLNACEYEMQERLSTALFNDDKQMLPEVREQLLKIAADFYESTGFTAPIQDIILTGSMANYNYHDGSDIDVHILIVFSDENEDIVLVTTAANALRWKWNQQHNITIAGHEVELYIQDANEPHTASGQYSLQANKWLVEPTRHSISTSESDVLVKVNDIMLAVNKLEDSIDAATTAGALTTVLAELDELRYKALHLRRDAFAEGEDEFSVGNLAFKELRNNGTIERLLDLETALYDKLHSIESAEAESAWQTFHEIKRAIYNLHKRGLTNEQIRKALGMSLTDIAECIAEYQQSKEQ